jgi:hypothetical protein
MPSAQPALRSLEPHIHLFGETCPTCEQPIPNEKAKEIRVRAAAMEKQLTDAAEARAAQTIAAQTAEIEEAAKARIEQAERDKAEAVKKANDDATAKIEGQKLAEMGFTARLEAAEKARDDAEKAKADADTAAAQKLADAERAAKDWQEEARKQLEAADAQKAEAFAKVKLVESECDAAIEARVREAREAMDKDKAAALAKKDSENDEKTRKLLEQVHSLERKLEEKRADELGEGAHIQLLEALKEEFPEDHIRRIPAGASGASIRSCGTASHAAQSSMRARTALRGATSM